MTATDVTSAGFETGQLRNSLSNFETWPKFNFGKPGDFETGPCNLAGSGFETGVAVRALTISYPPTGRSDRYRWPRHCFVRLFYHFPLTPITVNPTTIIFAPIVFNNALDAYKRRTKNDLLAHPLVVQLQDCTSSSAVLALIHQQVQGLQGDDDRLTKWLDPTVRVLHAFSNTLGEGVSLAFSPAKVIFAGVGVLLSAAMDVRASQETLIDIFERMETFFQRLEIYTRVSPPLEMIDIIVRIMVEVLSILAAATKEIKQGRMKKYLKKLIGKTDIEDALKKLDKLTNEEVRMVTAQVLEATHTVEHKVTVVIDEGKETRVVIQQMADDMDQVKRNQLRLDLHRWLSPPDPSINHNIACGAHRKQRAEWFFQGSIFTEWKSNGSLLWLHGKPGSGKSILCSTIIQDVVALRDAQLASMAYFYFDFRDTNKQNRRDLLPSLITQLSDQSHRHCDILNGLYLKHGSGAQKPSEDELIQCLKDMLTIPDQQPVYLIIDA
ncbi:hypothetical protein BGY98DRAFT_1182286, partial [Russula aff. rugulosa BPL654]